MESVEKRPQLPVFYIRLATIVQAVLVLLILGYPTGGHTKIFACQSAEDVIFQDRPCPQKKPTGEPQKTQYSYPLSIHKSWFELPEQIEERAFCDRRGCECGRIDKKHRESLALAVADALYLDGSWHRYNSLYSEWMKSSSSQRYDLRKQMLEASCEVMMSQELLRNYADDAMQILTKRARIAEERGFDVPLPCSQGLPEACELYESVKLLTRVRQDASALKRERIGTPPENEFQDFSDLTADP